MKTLLRLGLAVLGLLLLAFGALALAVRLAPYPAIAAPPAPATTFVPGTFHVHTVVSHDGHGTLDEVAEAAREVGSRFVVITEHNRILSDRGDGRERVVFVPAVEISSKFGHVVAIRVQDLPPDDDEILASIRRAGGSSFVAHPVNRRNPWRGPDDFAGFEALSLDSAFREALASDPWRIALAAAALVGDPRKAGAILMAPHDEGLARYDELSRERPVALACGVDAHGRPPYVASFAALQLHLDMEGYAVRWGRSDLADAYEVREMLPGSARFCSVPALGDASSFRFEPTLPEVAVSVASEDATLVLFKDGREVLRGKGPELRMPGSPGTWRAEVRLDPGFPYPDDSLWITSGTHRL